MMILSKINAFAFNQYEHWARQKPWKAIVFILSVHTNIRHNNYRIRLTRGIYCSHDNLYFYTNITERVKKCAYTLSHGYLLKFELRFQ